jgi:hypothetical protein
VTARDQRLLAYWAGDAVDPMDLRTYLAARVATQFVPSIITRLDAMPLTPSGKINRRALPEPASATSIESGAQDSAMATTIARVWQEVLHVPISHNANFFDLGGTSLTAATAQRRLGETLDRDLPVLILFQNPTVNALAKHLDGKQESSLAQRAQARAAAQRAAQALRTAANS